MSDAVVVLAIVAGSLVATWVPLLLWLRGRVRRTRAAVDDELRTDPPLRGPEQAVYRSGSGPYPRVKGNGIIALTRDRLTFRKLIGKGIEVALRDITGLREEKWFRGARTGGHVHLVIETTQGELAFFTSDNAAWMRAITAARDGSR